MLTNSCPSLWHLATVSLKEVISIARRSATELVTKGCYLMNWYKLLLWSSLLSEVQYSNIGACDCLAVSRYPDSTVYTVESGTTAGCWGLPQSHIRQSDRAASQPDCRSQLVYASSRLYMLTELPLWFSWV